MLPNPNKKPTEPNIDFRKGLATHFGTPVKFLYRKRAELDNFKNVVVSTGEKTEIIHEVNDKGYDRNGMPIVVNVPTRTSGFSLLSQHGETRQVTSLDLLKMEHPHAILALERIYLDGTLIDAVVHNLQKTEDNEQPA